MVTGLHWLVASVALLALSGCLGDVGECDVSGDGSVTTPWLDGRFMHTDPSSTWQTVVLATSDAGTNVTDLSPSFVTPGWTASVERLSAAEGPVFDLVTVTPGLGEGRLQVSYDIRKSEGACKATASGDITWNLAAPAEGASARPSQGVHVMTAGFYENGTLFYTNIAQIDQDSAWPRPAWYSWEGGDPLPVYVYDQDRAEEPAYWHGTTAGTPAGAPTQNATVWDYFTTIAGFNEALKGLSTNTVRVVRLAPEEAYTRPGNEAHPLYGAALVFYMKVLDVVDFPCPTALMASGCQVPSAAVNVR